VAAFVLRIGYHAAMSTRTADGRKRRGTTTVPVTTMEEVPVLSEEERAELLKSLKEAEERIEAGEAIDYDSDQFKKRLRGIYRAGKR
jgi:hypothetical protein